MSLIPEHQIGKLLFYTGVRLCTHKGQRNRSIFQMRQGLLLLAVDDVLADDRTLCSEVCLLFGRAASSHCSFE